MYHKNVGADYYGLEFHVTPFWKTLDGTIVEGDTVVKTINQGISSEKLAGKTALFVGDSIQDGGNYATEGAELLAWYQRLARYGMVTEEVANKGDTLVNDAISGKTNQQIVKKLEKAKQETYDFVILEGGVNDVLIDQDVQSGTDITIDWGTINEDPNATFSDDNIAGAMQDLIKTTKDKFPDATIVYLINHYFRASDENRKAYVAMVKEACRVHDISYVDLSDTEAYPSLEPLSYKDSPYIPDNLHPNAAGYDLSTPIIADHLRKLLTGELVREVYVASTGTDKVGYGTAEAPYETLNYAISQVADDGTVYVQDALVCSDENQNKYFLGDINAVDRLDTNKKQVTIEGVGSDAKLDFSSETFLFINHAVTLRNIQVKWPTTRIYVEGNKFTVEESVVQTTDSAEASVFAGSAYHDVERTDLKLYSGTYKTIVGGQAKYSVGETHVTVGKNVNPNLDLNNEDTSHAYTYQLFGGCYSEGAETVVSGNTYVTVEEGAKFNYIFGGGGINTNATANTRVEGETYVEFAGDAYGIYAGGYGSSAAGTNLKIIGGSVHQVFGGNEKADMSGDTDVQILKGTIKRRVFGGCYNDQDADTAYAVTGTTTVTISPEATLTLSSGTTQSLAAISRRKTPSDAETGIFIFNDYTDNATNIGKIGIDSLLTTTILGMGYGWDEKTHDYLVKVGSNGTATVVDGKLVVTPNDDYTATVTGATDTGDGSTYTLTASEVVVTFNPAN